MRPKATEIGDSKESVPVVRTKGRSRGETAHDAAQIGRAQEWRVCASRNTTRKEVSCRPERDRRSR